MIDNDKKGCSDDTIILKLNSPKVDPSNKLMSEKAQGRIGYMREGLRYGLEWLQDGKVGLRSPF